MSPPRKALIAVTSAHAPLYPDGKETGLFIAEALHPFEVFKKSGFEVDLVSETGSYQPDWLSQQKEWLKDEERKVWEDHNSEFRSKLDKLLKPTDVKSEEAREPPFELTTVQYGIFFASAGHASLIDYPDAKGLQSIAANMYSRGAIISAVCHGGAIFPGIKDEKTGKSIIFGKQVTGFTTQGEIEEGVLDTIKSWNRPTIEAAADSAGAKCKINPLPHTHTHTQNLQPSLTLVDIAPPGPWDAFSHTDGRIVTGANPASAQVTAEAAVKAFDQL
ncbi:class I glutamine amidotransferase-like protein [Curvularia clavata]|uniref:D-lactate dehydratase n=1 Tax=Curvularia clavata TaxID=95742 RepID=A0A9Q8ZEG1_CURCL|nr:class I glutamine amidotransferase-like protein [Curvularia clavata]